MADLTSGQLQTLADELTNDPEALGYADAEGNLKENAEIGRIINQERSAYSVERSAIPMGEVYGVVDWVADVAPISTDLVLKFMLLTSTPNLDGSSIKIRDAMVELFGAESNTVTSFDNLRVRDASRAEDLFGERASITMENLREARSL